MRHYVMISPVSTGCSFLPVDINDPALNSEQAVIDAQCGAAAAYRVLDRFGREAWVCVAHAAHIRGCAQCAKFLERIATAAVQ